MKHVQIINRKTIRLLLLIFVLTFCMAPVSSYADGPWTDRADQSIYDSTGDAPDSSTPDMPEEFLRNCLGSSVLELVTG